MIQVIKHRLENSGKTAGLVCDNNQRGDKILRFGDFVKRRMRLFAESGGDPAPTPVRAKIFRLRKETCCTCTK